MAVKLSQTCGLGYRVSMMEQAAMIGRKPRRSSVKPVLPLPSRRRGWEDSQPFVGYCAENIDDKTKITVTFYRSYVWLLFAVSPIKLRITSPSNELTLRLVV